MVAAFCKAQGSVIKAKDLLFIHGESGLAYERISTLAGCEVTFLERALREGRDMRVDDFCGIAEN